MALRIIVSMINDTMYDVFASNVYRILSFDVTIYMTDYDFIFYYKMFGCYRMKHTI